MRGEKGGPPNLFLAVLGVLTLGTAVVGLLLGKSDALVGGFLVGGLFLAVAAVVAPRMEGSQKVGLAGAEFNLGRLPEVAHQAEVEVRTNRLSEIEEIADGR